MVLSAIALQQFLHERFPLSRTMGVEVVTATTEGVTLSAPLEPNVNHHDTVFGGSASAVAILSAWALLYLRLKDAHQQWGIVIQRNTMNYERPITDRFTASSVLPDPTSWSRFLGSLARKHRARVHIGSILHCNGEQVGALEAAFVALCPDGAFESLIPETA
jgi:thioesterase domain-containing protein